MRLPHFGYAYVRNDNTLNTKPSEVKMRRVRYIAPKLAVVPDAHAVKTTEIRAVQGGAKERTDST